jgi:hypothetical protein
MRDIDHRQELPPEVDDPLHVRGRTRQSRRDRRDHDLADDSGVHAVQVAAHLNDEESVGGRFR